MKIRCPKCGGLLGHVEQTTAGWEITTRHTAKNKLDRNAKVQATAFADSSPTLRRYLVSTGGLKPYSGVKVDQWRKYHLECGKCWHFCNIEGREIARASDARLTKWVVDLDRFSPMRPGMVPNTSSALRLRLPKWVRAFDAFSVVEGNASDLAAPSPADERDDG